MWSEFTTFRLQKPIRNAEDLPYADFVDLIGEGAGPQVPLDILQRVQEGVEKPKPKVLFEPGQMVRVTDGPFNDFNGVVEEVNYDKSRLRVAVLIFGRSTPVELEFAQVSKAS